MSTEFFEEEIKRQVEMIKELVGSVGYCPMLMMEVLDDINTTLADVTQSKYTDKERSNVYKISKQNFLVRFLFANCNRTRYGRVVDQIHNDYVAGIDKYPETLSNAVGILIHLVVDGRPFIDEFASLFMQSLWGCWGCGKKGVSLQECTAPECRKKWVEKQSNPRSKYCITPKLNNESVWEENRTYHQHLNLGFE